MSAARRRRDAPPNPARVVGLRILLCTVLVLESTTYGVISPLLPQIVSDLRLPASQVGWLTGAYTTGMLPATVLLMSVRRPLPDLVVVVCGVISLGAGCLVMATVPTFLGILVARALMGVGAGLCFGGGTRWLVGSAPGREGFYFGLGWGMLSLGTAVGPVVGAIAIELGSGRVHSVLTGVFVSCMAGLVGLARGELFGSRASDSKPLVTGSRVASLLRRRGFVAAMIPIVVPALTIGLLFTLMPLRFAEVDHRGWIAPTFVIAAIAGAATSPLAGHALPVVGEARMVLWSLLAGAAVLAVTAWPVAPLALSAVTVLALGVTNQTVVVAVGEKLRREGDAHGARGASSTLVPLVFAIFETVGAVGSGKAAGLGQAVPFLTVVVVSLICVLGTQNRATAK